MLMFMLVFIFAYAYSIKSKGGLKYPLCFLIKVKEEKSDGLEKKATILERNAGQSKSKRKGKRDKENKGQGKKGGDGNKRHAKQAKQGTKYNCMDKWRMENILSIRLGTKVSSWLCNEVDQLSAKPRLSST